ncbi:PEP-CTERM motif protein [Lacunisphaera limnophila]|uniref:PEP-CTERM motif protein n=1 Tax=Lacunisphaera limnophila TaxID=1838286 RepID=A0A1D8AV85_9BACT|nr:PEP-CTERM sorting domain-containing protein [Lacunisphaera limnophila]AOS44814.1 PEP-CTERM motif protein [Lacunisphaera limnophila]
MSRRFQPSAFAVVLLLSLMGSLHAQLITYTWIGRNDDYYYDFLSPNNWANGAVPPVEDVVNSRLVFGPSSSGAFIGYYELYANQLKIEGITRSLELHGSYDTTHLGSGGIVYAPTGNVPSYLMDAVQLHASQTWNIQGGTFVVEGTISDWRFNGENYSNGAYALTKTGAGTLVLDTSYSNWTGGLTLNQGRLVVTGYAAYAGGLGEGPLTLNGGTLVGTDPYYYSYDPDQIQIDNDIVINGTLTTENKEELRLGYHGEGNSEITLATDVTIRSVGEPLFLSGAIGESGGARKLTIDSDGAVIIDGPTAWTGGTDVTKGVLIFDSPMYGTTLPATGAIKVGSLGYAGITSNTEVAAFFGKLDPTSTGSIGFDSDPNASFATTFSTPINLAGLNGTVRIGSATAAVLDAAATITPFGNTYRFGGGGGFLEVQSALTDAAGPVVRNVVLDSPAQLPLSVRFSSAGNTFTGGVSATHSAALFTADALPGTGALTLGDGGYIGLFESANPAQDFINRFATTTDRGMIGFDATSEHVTISSPLNLSGFTDASPGIYLGTHTRAHLDGPITPQGSIYRFGAYKGGELTVNTTLTGTGNSVHIGDPTSLGTMGDITKEEYSRVVLKGNNTYGGTTTLYAGELVIGQSNGTPGTDPTTALGTGALIVQPHQLTLPAGDDDVRPQITGYSNLIIPNALQLNADVNIAGYETALTFTGNLTGTGEIYTEGALALTLAGNNTGFSGGIYLSDYTILTLANNTAAGTGPIGFGYSNDLEIIFETAAPVLGGLYSNGEDYEYESSDYAALLATQADTVLTINQVNNGSFNGEFRSDAPADSLRLVKEGAGTLHLLDGGLFVHNGVNVTTPVGEMEVSLQVNNGTVVINDDFYIEDSTPAIWVNGGTLAVSDGGYVGNPLVITSGKLAGSGYFNTATIGTSTTLSPGLPGNPIGRLNFSDLTLAAGGTLEWNVHTADPLAQDYDLVTISNPSTLHITAGTTADDPLTTNVNEDNRFTLKLVSLQANGTAGILTGLSGNRSYTWTLFDATSSSIVGFDPSKFIIDASLFFTDLPIHTLVLQQNGNLLQLTFQPVPEPSTYALLALGLGFIGLTVWRKRRA